jgi:hypothetical protein
VLLLASLALTSGCGPKNSAPDPAAPNAAAPAATPNGETVLDVPDARKGGASVFVVHLMSDFDAFKGYFEAGAEDRAKAGVKGHLLTKLDDGRAVVHFFADDAAVVEEALRSPDMQKYLSREGAPETSVIWLTRDVVVKAPATPPAGETYSLYLKLKTANLPALEGELRQRGAKILAEQGVVAYGLHQSTVDETIAILHVVGTARDKLVALPERKEFRELVLVGKSQIDSRPLLGLDVARARPPAR